MGKWLCGKCAEGNGGICPGKSIKIAIMVAGLRVDMYPGPPEHEAGVAVFDINLCDLLGLPWFHESGLTN
jgi:hypothetical protein